jgi:Apocytochrome F, N-terminal
LGIVLGLLVILIAGLLVDARLCLVGIAATPVWPAPSLVADSSHVFARQIYTSVFPGSTFNLLVEIPTSVGLEQVSPTGVRAQLNVGGVIVLPEGFRLADGADGGYFSSYSPELNHVLVFGPEIASRASTLAINIHVPADTTVNTYQIVIAGNRGRGQLYPDGAPSNNSAGDGWLTRIHTNRDRSNMACWNSSKEASYLVGLPAAIS